jgi:formylglycine-generating enzyme required for sulfatase activity
MKKILIALFVLSSAAWASNPPPTKVTTTGAVFTLDLTYPDLGDAYADPEGLIWSDLMIRNNRVFKADFETATAHCESLGARLPSKAEFERLAKHLGKGARGGYNPYMANGQPVMLGLALNWFWTSTPYWFRGKQFQNVYVGDSAVFQTGNRGSKGGAFYCVVGQ